MARIHELRMISRIAQMYYSEGLTQSKIGDQLHLSQTTVSRLLKKAVKEEIVRTTVIPPAGTYSALEDVLRRKFELTEVVIAECTEDRDGAIMTRIGEAAAHFIENTMQSNEIIGISSWSETILKMVDNFHPTKVAHAKYVVQILGGMGNPSVQTHATQLTSRLAKLTGAETQLLTTPGVAQSREARVVLLSDTYVRATTDRFDDVSLAVVGIGSTEPSNLLSRSGNIFSNHELCEVAERGGIGDICLRFFDESGQLVKTPIDERVIGMDLDQLRRVNRVIALAGGQSKTKAIYGALNTGVIDILVTDKFTARRLIEI